MSSPSAHRPGELENISQVNGILALEGGAAGAVVQRVRAPQVAVDPLIDTPKGTFVVVKKSHTTPARVEIILKTSVNFRRSGTLTRTTTPTSGDIHLFGRDGKEIQFNQAGERVFTAGALNAGVHLFAEANGPSSNVGDFVLKLTLAQGPTPVGAPAEVKLTAVLLTLDICTPRTSPAQLFTPLPQPPATQPPAGTPATDKWFGGLVLNTQDTGNNQLRAQLIVRQVIPTDFAGKLILRQVKIKNDKISKDAKGLDDKVQVFDAETPGPKQTPPIVETPKPNPFPNIDPPATAAGLMFFAEGRKASTALRDTGFQLGIDGGENDGDRVALTVAVAPVITVDSPIVVMKKSHTTPLRRVISVRTSTDFNGTGNLTRSLSGPIRIFDAAIDGNEINLLGGHVVSKDDLKNGVQFFAESVLPSGTLNDYRLTLTLIPDPPPDGKSALPVGAPATVSMTAVDFTLDVSAPRITPGVDPPVLSPAEKVNTGRFVQLRDAGNSHVRAMIIVGRPNPLISATLTLTPVNARVRAFSTEVPAAGETPLSNPHTILSGIIPTGGVRSFVEGTSLSGAARDTGFRLGVQGLENEADRVDMTVFDLAVSDNVAPFATAIDPVQIEGILNASLSGFNLSSLIGIQTNSLFRIRVEMPGVVGNTLTVRLLSTATPVDPLQVINLTRTGGDRFVSLPILAIPEVILRPSITFTAPPDIAVVRSKARGTFRLEMAGVFAGAAARVIRVRGRVINIFAQAFTTSTKNVADIRLHIQNANQLWAQAGIEVKERTLTDSVVAPAGLDDIDFIIPFVGTLSAKEQRLLGLTPGGPTRSAVLRDMNVYYVRRITGTVSGVAYSGESFPGLINDPNNTAIAIEGPVITGQGLAHELGHHILRAWGDEHKDQATPPVFWPVANIMHPADTGTATTIDRTQVINILNSTSAGNHPCIVFEP